MNDPHKNAGSEFNERLTRIETTVENLSVDVRSLASSVKTLADSSGRPNYNLLAILLTIAGGMFMWVQSIETRLTVNIDREIARNNAYGERIATTDERSRKSEVRISEIEAAMIERTANRYTKEDARQDFEKIMLIAGAKKP